MVDVTVLVVGHTKCSTEVETTNLIETFSYLDDKTDVQSDMTDGQSLQPLVRSQSSMEELAETFRTSR